MVVVARVNIWQQNDLLGSRIRFRQRRGKMEENLYSFILKL